MSIPKDKTMGKILNEAAEHFAGRLTPGQIEEIYLYYYKKIREAMEDPFLPRVDIPKLGSFRPSKKQILEKRLRIEKFISQNPDTPNKFDLDQYVHHLMQVYSRVKEENDKESEQRSRGYKTQKTNKQCQEISEKLEVNPSQPK